MMEVTKKEQKAIDRVIKAVEALKKTKISLVISEEHTSMGFYKWPNKQYQFNDIGEIDDKYFIRFSLL